MLDHFAKANSTSPADLRGLSASAESVCGRRSQALPSKLLPSVCLSILLTPILAQPALAQTSIDERPGAFAMVGDLLVARPIGAVMTAAGAAAFVVSLPLTALAGSVAESAETLVLGPAETTFVRCLGCIEPGYSYKDVERRQERRADGDGMEMDSSSSASASSSGGMRGS